MCEKSRYYDLCFIFKSELEPPKLPLLQSFVEAQESLC
eukprot:SAG31_NODE_38014_length_299_cov_1.560000_1_plen_37_part_01